MPLISPKKPILRADGQPRRKPGPKPRTVARIEAADAAADALAKCIQAHDAAPSPQEASRAYRKAMPPLHAVGISGWAELVAQGMARQVFSGKEASTMLYAAQIAHSGRNR
jgi:hypothetical protein